MNFLDIVVFGKTKKDMADALEHAVEQLRMGTVSESLTWEDGSHVTFDIRDCAKAPNHAEKYAAYTGLNIDGTEVKY